MVEELEPWGFIDQVENLINSLESIDLCFELLDVVPINYFKSHDSFKLAMVLYNLGEEQKANEIILNLDDNIFKLLYYIYSINKSKLDLDENFIENILLNISNPILQLQFLEARQIVQIEVVPGVHTQPQADGQSRSLVILLVDVLSVRPIKGFSLS